MKYRIKTALLGLAVLLAYPSAKADDSPQVVGQTTMDDKTYTLELERTFNVAPAGETITLNIREVADDMHRLAGVTQLPGQILSYSVKKLGVDAQQLQLQTKWVDGIYNELKLIVEANPGITTLTTTIKVEIESKSRPLNGSAYPKALITYTLVQEPTAKYNINPIKGEKTTEYIYNGSTYECSVSYFDKAGRLVQKIKEKASPNRGDIVDFYQYDKMGHKDAISYMSYVKKGTACVKRSDPLSEQKAFYTETFPSADDHDYAYSSKQYAKLPFDVVLSAGAAGKRYSIDGGVGKNITQFDHGRSPGGYLHKYIVHENSMVGDGGLYEASALTYKYVGCNVSSDQTNATIEYRDSQDHVVAKESKCGTVSQITYYVYDDFGRLRYIIPPEVDKLISGTRKSFYPEAYSKYWYYNEYDSHGRIVISLKPGKEEEYSIYDQQGNLVMSQDGNLRAENKWIIIYYDTWQRPTCKYILADTGTTPLSRQTLQTMFDNDQFTLGKNFKVVTDLGRQIYDKYETFPMYGNTAFVNVEDIATTDMLAVNNDGRLVAESIPILPAIWNDNQSHGTIDRAYYYDMQGRQIQSVEYDSYYKITSRLSTKYDTVGNVLLTIEEHTYDSKKDVKRTEYVYDEYGYLLSEITTVNDLTPVTVSYTYDELGNTASRKFVNTGIEENYTYNLRGSLTKQDSQRMLMEYTYDTYVSNYNNKPRFDGNLSLVKWQYKTITPQEEAYVYDYNYMGQLASGIYHVNGTPAGIYDEYIQYADNGNITNMKRIGSTATNVSNYAYHYDGYQISSIDYTKGTTSATYQYRHDANGNLSYDGRKSLLLSYNYLNLTADVITYGAPVVFNLWLSDGTKYASFNKGTDYIRVYKGSFTYDNNHDVETILFNGGQFVSAETDKALTPTYVITDNLGSVRVVMNDKGSTLIRNTYYPFGLTHYDYIGDQSRYKANRFLFNGKEKQALGPYGFNMELIDYGARMYDPTIGRWTTQDPAYQLINPYVFCGNNPANYIDPDGQWAVVDDVLAMVLGGLWNSITELVSGEIHSVLHFIASFGVGAAAGEVSLYASPMVGGAVLGAGNSLINQGFNQGWNNVNYNKVLLDGVVGGSIGAGTAYLGNLASPLLNNLTKGIASPVLREGVNQGILGSVSGFAIGTGSALLQGNSIEESLKAGGKGSLFGLTLGFTSGATNGYVNAKANYIDPWTGVKLGIVPSSTGGMTDITPTLQRIDNGIKHQHRNDGIIFENNKNILPTQDIGHYREYVHPTPGIKGAGAMRVVKGADGKIYYTPDHYKTFIKIK